MHPDYGYRYGYSPFARYGEMFITVSPGGNLLRVSNAQVIRQITMRREDFPKNLESYGILDQFGRNVVTTEGALWRMHRKATSISFNEKNAGLVFHEAARQMQGLLDILMQSNRHDSGRLETMDRDMMELTLHIIGYVGFGLQLLWPRTTLPSGTSPKLAKYTSMDAADGHSLSFVGTLSALLDHLLWLLLMPVWLLRKTCHRSRRMDELADVLPGLIPSKHAQLAAESNENWVKYMDEMLDDKTEDVRKGEHVEGMDLMGHLVQSSFGKDKRLHSDQEAAKLTKKEIVGNAFIMFLAGHETTANTLHFSILEMAINPECQRLLQRDIVELVGTSDPGTWDYEKLVNPMMASMLGAVMNETLRVLPAVTSIPKQVSPHKDQVITKDGEKFVLPKGMAVWVSIASAQRNPRYWPSKPSRIRPGYDDVDDYVPERWFRRERQNDVDETDAVVEEDWGGFRGPDTSSKLFHPERGAYIPFSDGARACLGRRLAQVEVISALAVLFQRYSVELDVSEWADGAAVEGMTREERKGVYEKAQKKSRETLARARTKITLKLASGEYVPVRVVRRGQEKFVDWM